MILKTSRLVIGIISIVFFGFVMFQSCAAGVVEFLEEDEESTASAAGFFVSIMFLITGITAICTRKVYLEDFVVESFIL